MNWIEVRNSRGITASKSGKEAQYKRKIEWIVDELPEYVRGHSETPQLGDEYETYEGETLPEFVCISVSIDREPDAEDDYCRVVAEYEKRKQFNASSSGSSDSWERDITWSMETGYHTQPTLWGKKDAPPNDYLHHLLDKMMVNLHDYTRVGKNGEGVDTAIPYMTLTVTRDEPGYPAKDLLNLAGSINSNDDWVFYGDQWKWKFEGSQAKNTEYGAEITYNFSYDIFNHTVSYFELAETQSGSKTYRPLNKYGEPIQDTKEVYFDVSANLIPSSEVEDARRNGDIRFSVLVPRGCDIYTEDENTTGSGSSSSDSTLSQQFEIKTLEDVSSTATTSSSTTAEPALCPRFKYVHNGYVLPQKDFTVFNFFEPGSPGVTQDPSNDNIF